MVTARLAALALMSATFLGLAAEAAAQADKYPSRPIRWIVPYPPAGTTDILARIMGQWLSQQLQQQVVIDNRPGAGNNIGTELAIKALPDGHTVFLVNPANAINASLYTKLPFNFLQDMEGVAGIVRVPNMMVVTRDLPAKSVPEFIDYAKKNPGKVNLASSGSGTSVHLTGELFKAATGLDLLHVPFKGAGPALIELVNGRNVQVIFDNMPSSIGHVKGGTLRALAVTTAKRSSALPDVPTVAETIPGFEASAWFGMSVPKGTPAAVIARLNKEMNAGLNDPKMRARLAELGGDPLIGTPADFWKIHAMETEKWAKAVKVSGAKVE
ncbi:MAG: tripartite tricarboxylate transporter substrate binding protein [Burkholderiales bacterium]|nr:tripartite tricarboxylate transporter substrate binding protein [Burkholderiales bacterium]